MAAGGVYDQVGGGFHRYSVDGQWLVPHFEKMLYDNALLARDYALAHRVTGSPDHARIAQETLDYLLREMRLPGGGFAAAQDADSPGGEGAFFVWTPEEIAALLPEEQARAVLLGTGSGRRGTGSRGGRSSASRRRSTRCPASSARTRGPSWPRPAAPSTRPARSGRPRPATTR